MRSARFVSDETNSGRLSLFCLLINVKFVQTEAVVVVKRSFVNQDENAGVPTAARRHCWLRTCVLGESHLVNPRTAIYLGSRMVSSTDSAT
jgi:hypothetical protein